MLEQQTRLKSLNNLLTRVGFEKELFEDFADETFKLLSQLASLAPAPIAASALLKSFNNDEISSAIITHFRVCAVQAKGSPRRVTHREHVAHPMGVALSSQRNI